MKTEVIIMCKAPVAGRVKTRLLGRYSATQAARIHAEMATTVIRRAARLFEHVRIAVDDPAHPFFSGFGLPLRAQGDGDLGVRMERLMRQAFAEESEAVLFLGTDSPHMADTRLLTAVQALQGHDLVIGPVEDGGYDLIGMTAPWPVFAGIAWSSGQVLVQTLAHVRRLGLSYSRLQGDFDIDTPEDLERAAQAGWQPRTSGLHPSTEDKVVSG